MIIQSLPVAFLLGDSTPMDLFIKGKEIMWPMTLVSFVMITVVVERIIFISTPHRGSGMADWSLTTWFTKFIHLPSKLTSAAVDLIPTLLTNPEHYTSISRLSPSNPLYKALEKLPIQAPHHSIIGDRGRGDTPNSSDGVVPYWSSHLDSAESEVIVPDDHGSFDDPAAIAEIKRILEKNHARR